MKENRKLLKEVLKDIQHDMSDEEVLNLLADSKISESPATEKYTLGQRAADAIAIALCHARSSTSLLAQKGIR